MKVPFSTYTTEALNRYHLTLAPHQPSMTAPIEYRVVATDLPGFTIPPVRIEQIESHTGRPAFEVYILNEDGSKPKTEYSKGNYWDISSGWLIAQRIHDLVMQRYRDMTGNVQNAILTVTVMSTNPEVIC
jgi:hypothetical protein